MPVIRTKKQPWLEIDVSPREYENLKSLGLVLDLDPVVEATPAEAPVKAITPKKKADKAPTTENEEL